MRTAAFYSDDLRALEDRVRERFSELRRLHKVIDFTRTFDNSPIDNLEDLVEEIVDKDLWEELPGVEVRNSGTGLVEEGDVLLINENGILVIIDKDPENWQYLGFNDLSEIRERIGLLDDMEILLKL